MRQWFMERTLVWDQCPTLHWASKRSGSNICVLTQWKPQHRLFEQESTSSPWREKKRKKKASDILMSQQKKHEISATLTCGGSLGDWSSTTQLKQMPLANKYRASWPGSQESDENMSLQFDCAIILGRSPTVEAFGTKSWDKLQLDSKVKEPEFFFFLKRAAQIETHLFPHISFCGSVMEGSPPPLSLAVIRLF